MSERDSFPLVRHLQRLAERDDRAALAALRRGLGKPPGTVAAMFPHVVPYVPDRAVRAGEEGPYYVVAALFALHPDGGAGGDLGWTMRRLGGHASAEDRFRALLECRADDLPHHLRQVVALARSAKRRTPVDYDLLLRHLLHWDHPDRWVQRGWARSYWGGERQADLTTEEE